MAASPLQAERELSRDGVEWHVERARAEKVGVADNSAIGDCDQAVLCMTPPRILSALVSYFVVVCVFFILCLKSEGSVICSFGWIRLLLFLKLLTR
jgi:hypothetical protein